MTQEHKELLLKDLCTRLPYGVKCIVTKSRIEEGQKGDMGKLVCICLEGVNCTGDIPFFSEFGNFKPYLFPMSSMTEEEFTKLKEYSGLKYDQLDLVSFQNGTYKCLDFYLSEVPSGAVIRVFDWLNTYHFDYRDLIQMGLAIDATKLNIY